MFLLELVHYTGVTNTTYNFNWKFGLLLSSFLSLIIGTVLGLSQSRIKRLFAYSTISHIGFILLAISIDSLESIEAFVFYLMQYTISNLNAFIILIAIGFSLYTYVNDGPQKDKYKNMQDINNSPIQLISQLKGYFYINPMLALSLAITLFSFVGIPPLIGFFAKQMVLSAALDNGYVFLTLVAIFTSVISAAYYLGIIKQIFFDNNEYKLSEDFENVIFRGEIAPILFNNKVGKTFKFNLHNITLASSLSITISILSLILLLFMLNSGDLLHAVQILALLMVNP